MEFKEFARWKPDEMPETTDAVVVVSSCGKIVKRLQYKRWNRINGSYSIMKEYIYKQSSNRGKQRFESEEKIKKHGVYMHVEVNNKIYPVHRAVAIAFISNQQNLDCVNHINGIRNDNRVENLEWVSNKENVRHAWDTGLRCRERMKKIDDNSLPEIIKLKEKGLSNPKIGKLFGVTGETIRLRVKEYEDSFRN